jgi:hypothetical protein
LREAQKTIDSLKDLNQQKVCAVYTLLERQSAIRRLRVALSALQKDLETMALVQPTVAGQVLVPYTTVSYLGIDNLDPRLFEDDEETVRRSVMIAGRISAMNTAAQQIRAYDVSSLTTREPSMRKLTELYEQSRKEAIVFIEVLRQHIDDRYGSQKP